MMYFSSTHLWLQYPL